MRYLLLLTVLLHACKKQPSQSAPTPAWPSTFPDSIYPDANSKNLLLAWRTGGERMQRRIPKEALDALRLVRQGEQEQLWITVGDAPLRLFAGESLAVEGASVARWAGLELQDERSAPEELGLVQPEPEQVDFGALGRDAIDRVVRDELLGISGCYQSAFARDRLLGGWVVARFVIARDGAVASATIKGQTLGEPAVTDCIVDVVSGWRFDAPDPAGIVIVSYPFMFSPSE